MTVGAQMAEVMKSTKMFKAEAQKTIELLELVGIQQQNA